MDGKVSERIKNIYRYIQHTVNMTWICQDSNRRPLTANDHSAQKFMVFIFLSLYEHICPLSVAFHLFMVGPVGHLVGWGTDNSFLHFPTDFYSFLQFPTVSSGPDREVPCSCRAYRKGTNLPCLVGGKGKYRQVQPSWLVYTFPFLQSSKAE